MRTTRAQRRIAVRFLVSGAIGELAWFDGWHHHLWWVPMDLFFAGLYLVLGFRKLTAETQQKEEN